MEEKKIGYIVCCMSCPNFTCQFVLKGVDPLNSSRVSHWPESEQGEVEVAAGSVSHYALMYRLRRGRLRRTRPGV
ncbi:hypothetical protein BDV26DRAFT_23816 [Aspergillus bertholletiae]|uniref:Uncharacterized protein n=1 Tax=Aspergillus bertholletiae TaxID=1226010 RepID=A0A5N7AZ00_9EURO|nr:hypothetical protein BDV26DRAFT_23816 [Aspergillus bertholletiae]